MLHLRWPMRGVVGGRCSRRTRLHRCARPQLSQRIVGRVLLRLAREVKRRVRLLQLLLLLLLRVEQLLHLRLVRGEARLGVHLRRLMLLLLHHRVRLLWLLLMSTLLLSLSCMFLLCCLASPLAAVVILHPSSTTSTAAVGSRFVHHLVAISERGEASRGQR